jgi:hypothetical protein
MTQPRLLSSAEAVKLLSAAGINDPQVLGIWAKEGLLEAYATTERLAGQLVREREENGRVSRWFWGELGREMLFASWPAGIFKTLSDYEHEYGVQSAEWELVGVSYNADQLERLVGGAGPSPAAQSDTLKGKLPTGAKPSDRKYEQSAHDAAKIVREEGVLLSEAIRRVECFESTMIKPESVERGIRRTYEKMYKAGGLPIQIDQD